MAQAYGLRLRGIQHRSSLVLKEISQQLPDGYRQYAQHSSPEKIQAGLAKFFAEFFPDQQWYLYLFKMLIFTYPPLYFLVSPTPVGGSVLYFLWANKRIGDLLNCLEHKLGLQVAMQHGGKHDKIIINGHIIPFPRGLRKGIPSYILSQICMAASIDRKKLIELCL